MVQFEDVTKIFPAGIVALRSVSFRIDPGEFVFLVGPTGTGKSTLLRLIYRDEIPTTGRVCVLGRDVGRLRGGGVALLRRRLGVVFQDFKLLPRRTAWENVAFVLRVTGVPPDEVRPRALRALDLVGVAHRAEAYPAELSGGEQQRVSIARAIAGDPPLLLADEPTGNLDPRTSWEIIRLLAEINARGTTVLVATHNKAIVDACRQRVIELAGGRVVRDQPRGRYAREA
ncbi:MAG: cell division ATP-binding protein FtsE [Armatimonadota bacterium]|nr:cell division ATP-binding protein FtsE [Armatimonadota bacterium]MDR7400927.1 cell division ATP-binding protein FtsE [Armatimonadota bacterium]MDR7437355.1 cell division ATP-binding protein FtsE [Armatimonadota bacterium]MDR7472829.1 cell division ATP-binding protein FtsE [Armatimonadota bacterium]MDR7506820.1 cell division ATP-binding protein FtsE [Armatimonadota bacterium]